jgi:lycopene beta-cyclase
LKTLQASHPPTDLIIIGAGAAGLSLLLSLDDLNYPYNVTVLERNNGPSNDRIWSFWDNTLKAKKCPNIPSYINAIISHKWSNWTLTTDQRSYAMGNSAYQYCSLRSEDLSALAQKRANENPKFNIIYNCDVTSLSSHDDLCSVTTRSEQLIAHKVVDTRPPPIDKNHDGLLQCFYGEEITVEAEVFEPTSVKLMHQLKHSVLGLEFVYILPFSAEQALVEFTCFSPHSIAKPLLKARLAEIIKDLVKEHKYFIERTESAVLPMYIINKNTPNTDYNTQDQTTHIAALNTRNIRFAGIAGGSMRAATGYSFLSSQRWANQCAYQLNYYNVFSNHEPISAIYRSMDMIMLKVLRDDLSMGVKIFEQMFKKVKPDRFARFMIQQATFFDFLHVIWAMPKTPFFKAACAFLLTSRKFAHVKAVEKSD